MIGSEAGVRFMTLARVIVSKIALSPAVRSPIVRGPESPSQTITFSPSFSSMT